LYRALAKLAPSGLEESFEAFLDYAVRHHRLIERFGRFPHRNDLLERDSTPEELEFLASGGDTFVGRQTDGWGAHIGRLPDTRTRGEA
jgi:uncharacterized protein (DUF924 family)